MSQSVRDAMADAESLWRITVTSAGRARCLSAVYRAGATGSHAAYDMRSAVHCDDQVFADAAVRAAIAAARLAFRAVPGLRG